MSPTAPFARLVSDAMRRGGLALREVCRRAELDPSLMSKVLAGKRNPPADEDSLRRLAAALSVDPIELIVGAGVLPSDWDAVRADPHLLAAVHAVATGRRSSPRPAPPPSAPPAAAKLPRPAPLAPARGLAEELL